MNVILGGGLAALCARDILGDDWSVVPIGRSLYYSFDPPLDNNYIIRDNLTDEYFAGATPIYIKNVFSVGGQLTDDDSCLDDWLYKKYGDNIPAHAKDYWRAHMGNFAYPGATEFYRKLQYKYKNEIISNNSYGGLIRIDIQNHTLTLENKTIEYKKLINTIPMHAFIIKADLNYIMKHRDMWCYHIRASNVDLEGATNALIVDKQIDFYTASKVGNIDYIFKSTKEIVQPGMYFMSFLKNCELINESVVPDSIVCGQTPRISELEGSDITNIGSGEGDDLLDIGSVIKRLTRIKNAS